ncbi:MAG: hypothetical protein D6681_20970 [Calditrichaeota bacterium]|nr:MAG: hypothetical protein D6681_20970 [Calditrichota bacterium]
MPDLSPYLGLPPLASEHGHNLDYMLSLVHWLMLILFVIWTPYFIYVLFRFRQKKHPRADYRGAKGRLANWQEIGVIVSELILLFAFAIPTWATLKQDFPDEREALVIHVVAEQFAWNVHYPGPDGVFGPRSPERMDASLNPLGIDFDDPYARDDITTVNELRIPVGRPIIVHVTSKDVIHSFSLNAMRVKQDAIPGLDIPVYFTATRTGNFEINCAQLCGLGHYRMRGRFIIQTAEEFEAWMQQKLQEIQEYGR